MPRTGRRPGESGAREAILEAARSMFASSGYERATIRAIAAGVGVDPALVHHYFGTKEDLFVAVIDAPINPADAIRAVLAEGLEGAGERMVRFFLSVWDEPRSNDALMSVLRGALTNDRAAAAIREFAGGPSWARWLAPCPARMRPCAPPSSGPKWWGSRSSATASEWNPWRRRAPKRSWPW